MSKTNTLRIEFSALFNKQRKDAPLSVKIAFQETLELFLEKPRHPLLHNHQLQGPYAGIKSIDVTADW